MLFGCKLHGFCGPKHLFLIGKQSTNWNSNIILRENVVGEGFTHGNRLTPPFTMLINIYLLILIYIIDIHIKLS